MYLNIFWVRICVYYSEEDERKKIMKKMKHILFVYTIYNGKDEMNSLYILIIPLIKNILNLWRYVINKHKFLIVNKFTAMRMSHIYVGKIQDC